MKMGERERDEHNRADKWREARRRKIVEKHEDR